VDGDKDVLDRGAILGRYLVLERLGAGAMGVVYAAYDPELDRKVAIKVLRPQSGVGDKSRRQARLVREAKAIAKLSHPNVVGIFDVGVHEGQVFLAMEYLGGGTLREWMTAAKRPWRETVAMFTEVGKGLAAAHAEGLIHRDFKPDNVLLDKAGKPKVVDFGLVRLTGDLSSTEVYDSQTTIEDMPAAPPPLGGAAQVLTKTGALAGTPAYMAPEQFLGKEIDARTDQFAFLIALYEALYGHRPFAGENIIALADSVTSERLRTLPRNTEVPNWLRGCIVRGLRLEPSQRYRDINDLLFALANDPAKRRRNWLVVGTTLLVTVGAVGVTHRLGSKERTKCTEGGSHLAGIWEPGAGASERKSAIHRAFLASGKSYAERAFAGVSGLLDKYVERWTGMYTEACQATNVRGEQSAEVLDLRMECLREHLGNARALSEVFVSADGQVVENAVSAAAALPSLDRCADVAQLRAVVKPPGDSTTRKHVDDLRRELATLIAWHDSGQCARAVPKAISLISEARGVGYQPLLADVLYASAQLGLDCGDVAETLERFREAHAAASASHSDEVAAIAAAVIAPYAMNRLGQMSVAREWMVVARGDIGRLGRETLADAMLAQANGMVALQERDYGRALSAADRSIEITRRLLGPDHPLTISLEGDKGDWQQSAGFLDEALKTDIEARQHMERVLGQDHPRVGQAWNNQGEVLNLLNRHPEADAAYRRAIQLFRQSGGDPILLGWALTGLGRALLGEKQPDAATDPLEEALELRIKSHAAPEQLSETRFALGCALWSRPSERRRALQLVVSARNDYGKDEKAGAEIDAWLAKARTVRL
jgi:serine/threonine protein kinase/tetratricopeptide (TPR) repeat protein